MNKRKLSWSDVERLAKELAEHITSEKKISDFNTIYGVPRGGIYVALLLKKYLKLPLVTEPLDNSLLVDDIVDSGATIAKYHGKCLAIASLHIKPHTFIKPHFFVEETDDWVVYPWELEKEETIQDNVRRILEMIGENPNREGLLDTPNRVAKAYDEWFKGYRMDPRDILKPIFHEQYDEMITLCNIEFVSFCEHHMARIKGVAHVAYIPNNGNVVGLSKLARLVDCFASRLQIQERMTEQIASSLFNILEPLGCMVVIEAKHDCISSRGIKKQSSVMITSSVRGVFADPLKGARQEFLSLISMSRNQNG